MPRYRKKPVVIDAIQYTGGNINEIWDAFGAGPIYGPVEDDTSIYVDTTEGRMEAPPGWWIIRGVEGEIYACKPSVFDATYEPVVGAES